MKCRGRCSRLCDVEHEDPSSYIGFWPGAAPSGNVHAHLQIRTKQVAVPDGAWLIDHRFSIQPSLNESGFIRGPAYVKFPFAPGAGRQCYLGDVPHPFNGPIGAGIPMLGPSLGKMPRPLMDREREGWQGAKFAKKNIAC